MQTFICKFCGTREILVVFFYITSHQKLKICHTSSDSCICFIRTHRKVVLTFALIHILLGNHIVNKIWVKLSKPSWLIQANWWWQKQIPGLISCFNVTRVNKWPILSVGRVSCELIGWFIPSSTGHHLDWAHQQLLTTFEPVEALCDLKRRRVYCVVNYCTLLFKSAPCSAT